MQIQVGEDSVKTEDVFFLNKSGKKLPLQQTLHMGNSLTLLRLSEQTRESSDDPGFFEVEANIVVVSSSSMMTSSVKLIIVATMMMMMMMMTTTNYIIVISTKHDHGCHSFHLVSLWPGFTFKQR